MYVYTDDDLTRINRDFLGPKGRRLPFVLQYRTYGVIIGVFVLGWFLLFTIFGLGISQWTLLLYVFVCGLAATAIVQRLKRDVGLFQMFRAAAQEVAVPRETRPRTHHHTVRAEVTLYRSMDDRPAPKRRWWARSRTERTQA